MHRKIISIKLNSAASKTIIKPGDVLCKINGNAINDVLDYEYYSYDNRLLIEIADADGKIKIIRMKKPEGADIGLEFKNYLMDEQRSCANKCIFCFIDQLPKKMRKSLYYKDDDFRLSFLQGNYITLTNLTDQDIKRIIKLRISPINVSVHTLEPELRQYMLGGRGSPKAAGDYLNYLKKLARAKITINCQIVCCPGVNDGKRLSKTMQELMALGTSINSVSVVPVGLTKHRKGLTELSSFDKELAQKTIKQVEYYGGECLRKNGSRVFYAADELYIMAGLKLPPDEFYEDYPQLQNGVGMMRLFTTEFNEAKNNDRLAAQRAQNSGNTPMPDELPKFEKMKISLATGTLAAPYLTNLLQSDGKNHDIMTISIACLDCKVYAIKNKFFGNKITVSGLVTGGDIIKQLKGKNLGSHLLIPQNMLRHGGEVFLDDLSVADVSKALGVPLHVVGPSGADLYDKLKTLSQGVKCQCLPQLSP
ncbi:MAG: DUF512 domain-containing protein [Oscillospiraceae bacterium]|nr:DUF512 domain-containing protein [Oscillospiraceae bacterium]